MVKPFFMFSQFLILENFQITALILTMYFKMGVKAKILTNVDLMDKL